MSTPAMLHRGRALAATLVLALLAAMVVGVPATATDQVEVTLASSVDAIPNRYIVTLANGVDVDAVVHELRRDGVDVDQVYETLMSGFAGEFDGPQLRALKRDQRVLQIEQDVELELAGVSVQDPVASWGLDRIDQRERPLDGQYVYGESGAGTRIYILDTGVRSTHVDLAGRVLPGFSALGDGVTEDCHGHGTHVAGIAAGATYGVAKKALIVPVRVMNCSGGGSGSNILAGIDWIMSNHPTGTPGVANFSIVTSAWQNLDNRIQQLDAAGIVVAAGAGNDQGDACDRSPARSPFAITAGASTSTDSRWSSSNTGSCVDIFAPGSSITSTWHSSNTATRTQSGTSMASPHVAGAAALLLSASPSASTTSIRQSILAMGTAGVLRNIGDESPDRLLYTNPPSQPEPELEPEPEPELEPEPGDGEQSPGSEITPDPSVIPSTNAANQEKNWSHFNVLADEDGAVALEFVQPRNFAACFEYRVTGAPPDYVRSNFNVDITDGLWNFTCVGGMYGSGPYQRTVQAGDQDVEVRLVFGAERKERFWWTSLERAAAQGSGEASRSSELDTTSEEPSGTADADTADARGSHDADPSESAPRTHDHADSPAPSGDSAPSDDGSAEPTSAGTRARHGEGRSTEPASTREAQSKGSPVPNGHDRSASTASRHTVDRGSSKPWFGAAVPATHPSAAVAGEPSSVRSGQRPERAPQVNATGSVAPSRPDLPGSPGAWIEQPRSVDRDGAGEPRILQVEPGPHQDVPAGFEPRDGAVVDARTGRELLTAGPLESSAQSPRGMQQLATRWATSEPVRTVFVLLARVGRVGSGD
ncbi:MAG: S8 family serine peptidase [Nitriliruptoraceae bacterium]|nr:S8 family serine peptidase [Nitriliruptoraceae bacterium]